MPSSQEAVNDVMGAGSNISGGSPVAGHAQFQEGRQPPEHIKNLVLDFGEGSEGVEVRKKEAGTVATEGSQEAETEEGLSGDDQDVKNFRDVKLPGWEEKVKGKDKVADKAAKTAKVDEGTEGGNKAEDEAEVEETPALTTKSLLAGKGLNVAPPAVNKGIKSPDARDYSEFPEEWREGLKKTSNEAFNIFKQLHKENKELKSTTAKLDESGIPTAWYNHPQAYTLHPTYNNTVTKLNTVSAETQSYIAALEKIEDGEEFSVISGWDKNGSPIYSSSLKPTTANKAKVLAGISQGQGMVESLRTQANTFAQNFARGYQQEEAYVNDVLLKNFPTLFDGTDKEAVKNYNDFINDLVPSSFKDHPLARSAAALFTHVVKLTNENNQLKRDSGLASRLKQNKSLAEPTFSTDNSGSDGAASSKTLAPEVRKRLGIPSTAKYTPPPTFDLE